MKASSIYRLFLEQDTKNNITDLNILDFIIACMDRFPDYYWTVPSSVGKYHPEDEHGEGGLVTHTRRVLKICTELARLHNLNFYEKDVLVAASVLHDSFHRGVPPKVYKASTVYHPMFPPVEFPYKGFADKWLDERTYDEIMLCVVSHLGPYSPSKALNIEKKLPSIFRTADFVASRPYVTIDLN